MIRWKGNLGRISESEKVNFRMTETTKVPSKTDSTLCTKTSQHPEFPTPKETLTSSRNGPKLPDIAEINPSHLIMGDFNAHRIDWRHKTTPPIIINNSYVPPPQASILKWNTRRADWNLFEFARRKSTTDPIAQHNGDVTNGRKSNGKNKTTAVTFHDLDKAFERAQPKTILQSLIIKDAPMVHNPPYSPSEDSHTHRLHGCTAHPPETYLFDLTLPDRMPRTTEYFQNITQKLFPVHQRLPAEEKAKYLMRRSAIIHKTIWIVVNPA
ncbi:hypothetical protein LSH36_167g02005 [Paralvinella palmiformis]|uniref:Endonuclease/exonuclease/phosphatase domain-containing protein n=1 Tax=Paralvinella palmiformis TaxID=53620 RepID=A0AAD9N672_9ANNE|nr:hypothetical protein LSH36_167g02005 [Paralvinella palmiformis]